MNRKYLILLILWTGIFGYLTLQDGTATEMTGSGLSEWLINTFHLNIDPHTLHMIMRSAAHFISFFVEANLLYLTLQGADTGKLMITLAVCLFLCILAEAVKIPIDGRHFAWVDVGKNMIGSVLGAAGVYVYDQRRTEAD